ncbi:hypothetical protein MLD38_018890 [Melastoma candidum]|uniref:Uncharacterized protein n=1 Tax=Melastoma candidum TaxID=119954 RepID=A0ACB9QV60_9MYRT|nr:hypothetical protein MLD38_018890 [Melastoma candidum]
MKTKKKENRGFGVAEGVIGFYTTSILCGDSLRRAKRGLELSMKFTLDQPLKLQNSCFKNRGVYIKIGQHIGQLEYLVPDEYVQVMRESMLSKCPVSSFEKVGEVIKKELGETPDKIFVEFDPVPVASASLAQVHVAKTSDGRKVAVKELDFLHEAKNSEKCLDNFRKLSPPVADCRKKPHLILLDHGLYKELDVATRTTYANLWKALVFSNAKSIKEYCAKLRVGGDLYALFARILTMRPWNKVVDRSVDHLVVQGTDRPELQMFASQYFSQIAKLMTKLPREILLLLKTNDCLRAVNNALAQGSSLETYFIIGKISSQAVLQMKSLEARSLVG